MLFLEQFIPFLVVIIFLLGGNRLLFGLVCPLSNLVHPLLGSNCLLLDDIVP
jgi:hypothetical protein